MIVNAKNPTCASCARFPRVALDSGGSGVCAIFESPADYSHAACVLYEQAKDREARRAMVLRLNAAHKI